MTIEAGRLTYRELRDVFGLTAAAANSIGDSRSGSNKQHQLVSLLRRLIGGRLADHQDGNDAE